ncbi:MAG: ABC transporter ATP-binding protein [bacterium]
MDKVIISLENISKIYKLGNNVYVEALKDVSVEIKKGEFVAIMGPSGSGKSTLLNIIGCLDRPTQGVYLLEGTNVSKLSDNQLAEIRLKKIGFVFQTFNLLNRFTALRNVELPLIYTGIDRRDRQNQALKLLEKVDLKIRTNHKPTELSGGEAQRVAIARALVNNPGIILADEPTGNLDTKTSTEIMQIFQRLNQEGITILLITHNELIANFAHRKISLLDGEISKGQA